MFSHQLISRGLLAVLLGLLALPARAQSFRVQCPTSTITHPVPDNNNAEPAYIGPTQFTCSVTNGCGGSAGNLGYLIPQSNVNGAIKCQQIGGGDGFATMGDGTQTYMFSFGPLSGLAKIAAGGDGTDFPNEFNAVYGGPRLRPGDPATTVDGLGSFTYNGAIGLVPDLDAQASGICGGTGQASCLDGHVDPREIEEVGVMNGNIPAPLFAIDEDDEFFLTLTNVGMIMRPDLFEQHTVHFHGYPNASSFYDGVPDASVAINIGGSFTYYYLAPDAGTYFWHCHITPPEHLQMGMVGQLYVRPRQNRVPIGGSLYGALQAQQADLRTASNCNADILCTSPLPPSNGVTRASTGKYAYNDGDGSTYYDVEYPIQIHGFDPNFHFVGMTFNPEGFTDIKDKYFLLNGRSYPDTVTAGPMRTPAADGVMHFSQPLPTLINIPAGGRALLRISVLDVSDATKYPAGSTFYLYTPNLDHLSNDAENFGGLMTEVHIL